ncbi:hypothetical protein [Ostreiculturibacter nitratireducens]|uniref:hypothetical protein n=1 Tax=Ostreiculturibacter nitratireducens TaxID=3075226 RepID=UPI0031B623A5
MDFTSLPDFLARDRAALARGPVAVILIEDRAEVASTLDHHVRAGFREVLALTPADIDLPEDLRTRVKLIGFDTLADGALMRALNPLIEAAPPTTWFYWGYNAEYLFHPFCETRNVRELIAFHIEERRDAMLATVVDLYAPDLLRHPDAVNREEAMLDAKGYYAAARSDGAGGVRERQLDLFGGLRRRFEELVPKTRRRIDRISLFRAQKGLTLRSDNTFSIEEVNTYSCPWHHNLTAAVASFRTAKALKRNPSTSAAIPSFAWTNSVQFDWSSQQLMDLGLMEPGQWF